MGDEKDFNRKSTLQMDERQTDNEEEGTKACEQSFNSTLSEKEGCEQKENSLLLRHEQDPESLESVQRYAKRIKSFLGWEPYLEDRDTREKSSEPTKNTYDDENGTPGNVGHSCVNENESQLKQDDTEKAKNTEVPEKDDPPGVNEDESQLKKDDTEKEINTEAPKNVDPSILNEIESQLEKDDTEKAINTEATENVDPSSVNKDESQFKKDDTEIAINKEAPEKCEPLDEEQQENSIDLSSGSNLISNMSKKNADVISDYEKNIQENEVRSENELKDVCELDDNSVYNKDDSVEDSGQKVDNPEKSILNDSEQSEERISTTEENAASKGVETKNIFPVNLKNEKFDELYETVDVETVFPKDADVEESIGNTVNTLENEIKTGKPDSEFAMTSESVNTSEDIGNDTSQSNNLEEDDLKSEDSLDLDGDISLNDVKKPYLKEVRRLSLGIVKDVIQSARNSVHELYVNKNDDEDSEEISKKLERLFVENKIQGSVAEEEQSISDSFTSKESKTVESENSSQRNNRSSDDSILGKNADLYQTNDNVKNTKEIFDEKIASEENESEKCGYACFKPKCIQGCARPKIFLALFSIIGIIHGCYYTYVVSVISTLEKRYSFGSKISGTILLADEIVPLILGVFVGYFGGRMHRPRIVALGMFLSAACCFVSGFPYLIYGSPKHLMSVNYKNETGPQFCKSEKADPSCEGVDYPETMTVIGLFLFASLLKGFATLSYYVLGISYIDDIIKKKNTPLYLAIALALRLLGPLVGFLMSSGFLKLYENPVDDPGYGPDDPRWVGAWWIGFFLQGVLLVIFTLPIALFPRRLPGHKMENATSPATDDSLKDIFLGLLSALKRLGKNPIFLILIINTTMKIFGHFGHAIMLPKYMENQFRLSASEASLFSGATTIFCIMVSTVIGGFLIWKFRPRIKLLLCGMIVSEAVLCIGFLILMIPRCQIADMSHFGTNDEGLILNSVCNQNCDCSTTSFTPFCGPDGKKTFFSPCYAGCTQDFTPTTSSKKNKEFGNCSCVADPVQNRMGASISEGFCPDESCWNQALAYLIILFCCVTVSSLFTVAHTMILLRSVHPNDKSVALGTFETFICLFGFIPFPVTFGALVDSACLVWEKSCGEVGNCWFYDMDKFGYLLHGAAALFCFISVLCLITLYFLSSRVRDLYADEEEEKEYMDIKLDTVSGLVTKL